MDHHGRNSDFSGIFSYATRHTVFDEKGRTARLSNGLLGYRGRFSFSRFSSSVLLSLHRLPMRVLDGCRILSLYYYTSYSIASFRKDHQWT